MAVATTVAAALIVPAGSTTYADHETRDQVLAESSLDLVLVGLVMAAAVAVIVAFAAFILWWERQDAPAEERQRFSPSRDNE
jgi:hypothetical protein